MTKVISFRTLFFMKFDFENKVIEDILRVTLQEIPDKYVCTDKEIKVKKKGDKVIVPLFFNKDNVYSGYEKKIVHYYKNVEKYKTKGVDNVAQYLLLLQLQTGKLFGKEKKEALELYKYVKYREDFFKMGFLSYESYYEYKKLSKNTKNSEMYSLKKEYEKNKEEKRELGVYSLSDYIRYNKILKKSMIAYEKNNLEKEISVDDFLNFELREFDWKKQYLKEKGTLKGVQSFIEQKYRDKKHLFKSPPEEIDGSVYFKEPDYYYCHFGNKTFGEYFERISKISKIRHKYKSEKIEGVKYTEYLKNLLEEG